MATVLLVEDNEVNRDMLTRRLARKGFDVLIAVDGLQGVAMARDRAPQLILMDMSLPGIDGWEATRRLKADPATRAIPVIALTAHAMTNDREAALAAGCDEFDTKPVDLTRLLDKMARLLAASATHANVDQPATTDQPPPEASTPAPPDESTLTRPAVHASLTDFKSGLDRFCDVAAIDPSLRNELHVVFDEVLANVISYAYPASQTGALCVRLRLLANATAPDATVAPAGQPRAIELRFIDQGLPFDPLAVPPPDLTVSPADRPPGGFGLHLIRELTDHQHYVRTADGSNCLTLRKNLH